MELYFLRHGDAAPPSTDDAVLTPEGINSIRFIAAYLQHLGILFDQILASKLPRAQETADIVYTTLKTQTPILSCEPLTPPGSCDELLNLLRQHRKNSVLLVGHEPLLSQTISRLISGKEDSFITLKKGSIAKIFVADYTKHIRGSLEWLLTPSLIQTIRTMHK